MSEQLTPFATSTISVFLAEDLGAPLVIRTLEAVEQNRRVHNNEVFDRVHRSGLSMSFFLLQDAFRQILI